MRKPSGFALSTALVVIFFVMLAAFAMAGLATFNYSMARQAQLNDEALQAAQSGLAMAMNKLLSYPNWGMAPGDSLPESTIHAASSDPIQFQVTFNPKSTTLPWSVNNLNNPGIAAGPPDSLHQNAQRQVPPHTMLLFVRGQAGQGGQIRTRTLEALVQFPPTDYALAASNSIVCWDETYKYHTLSVGSWVPMVIDGKSGSDPSGNPVPGSIFAGGKWLGGSPPYSIFLTPGSTVSGNADAAGGQSGTNVVPSSPAPASTATPVANAVRDSTTLNETIPSINVTDYNNQATAHSPATGPNGELMIQGDVYFHGTGATPLILGSGPNPNNGSAPVVPIILDHGNLYVDGDAWFPGGIVGPYNGPGSNPPYAPATGSIYVNGSATVCLTFSDPTFTGEGVAIFTSSDLSLYPVGWAGSPGDKLTETWGNNPNAPKLVGTVYSRGNITVSDGIRLVGAMVAAGNPNDPSTGNIFFDQTADVTYVSTFAMFGNITSESSHKQMTLLYCREVLAP